ncbi:hypothetical protein [Fructobacillus ficulneus]|uniref:Uncharacterized protein n=1 Tax=Fructobacillus ficulneus TaxID=157463 RepID=A0A0K8MH68_9LACO|nr:hypothetical protein [Fructobacillus ficulneus]GAO99911.1 hypothetical protein FFIC_260250 [Fructobacillus ficulneus]
MTDKLRDYFKLLDKSYSDAVADLLTKYGPAKDNYYTEESYNDYMNHRRTDLVRGKTTRTDEGLYCHHIEENKYQNLSNAVFIGAYKYPYESQKKNRLVYCNLVEHAILHTLIARETDNKFGLMGLKEFLAPEIDRWYAQEEKPATPWKVKCYDAAYLSKEDATKFLLYVKAQVGLG